MFYLENRNFTISSDSLLGLIRLVDLFWTMLGSNFETVSEYNKAYIKSLEDTLIINIKDVA